LRQQVRQRAARMAARSCSSWCAPRRSCNAFTVLGIFLLLPLLPGPPALRRGQGVRTHLALPDVPVYVRGVTVELLYPFGSPTPGASLVRPVQLYAHSTAFTKTQTAASTRPNANIATPTSPNSLVEHPNYCENPHNNQRTVHYRLFSSAHLYTPHSLMTTAPARPTPRKGAGRVSGGPGEAKLSILLSWWRIQGSNLWGDATPPAYPLRHDLPIERADVS
jgi:hypothetical protein